MIHAAGLTPADKFEVINMANFDDEAAKETTKELIENEGEKVGDLVSILKEEALSDDEALKEISEATDVDVDIIKDAAETKLEAEEEGDANGLSKEEKQEYFSYLWRERMFSSIGDVIDNYEYQNFSGFLALFSEETITGEPQDEHKDTVEAIKIVKYVDDDVLTEEGAEEVADIIAEATDGDKEVIEEVLEQKEDAIAETAEAVAAYFSEEMNDMAVAAAIDQENAVDQALATFEEAGEEEAEGIEEGKTIYKTNNIHSQISSETPLTNIDPFEAGIGDDVRNAITAGTQQAYHISNTPSVIQMPNIAPGQNFSATGFDYKPQGFNPDVSKSESMALLPGAPETLISALQSVNFSSSDSEALAGVVAMVKTASMILK